MYIIIPGDMYRYMRRNKHDVPLRTRTGRCTPYAWKRYLRLGCQLKTVPFPMLNEHSHALPIHDLRMQ